MDTIKVDTEKLLEFANKMLDLKYEFDIMMKEISSIEDTLDSVRDVSTYTQREQLYYLEDMGHSISREFENFAEDLNYVSKEYQNAEEKIKDSIGEMFKNYHMKEIAERIKNGENIKLPLFVPNEYADYEEYLISEEEAKKYFTMGVFGTSVVDGAEVKEMPPMIAYKKNGCLYIYALCEEYERDIILGGEIKLDYNGLSEELAEKLRKYKYKQVYTNEPEPEIKRLDGVMPFIGGANITSNKSLLRGDNFMYEKARPNGIPKSYITSEGNLVPANVEGMYKGRQVTVTEHILGGYRKGAKGNSPYTSFTIDNGIIKGYGENVIDLDINKLRNAIRTGEVENVAILNPRQIERLIQNDKIQTEHWKKQALKWTKRDTEYLVRGEVPSEYIKINK